MYQVVGGNQNATMQPGKYDPLVLDDLDDISKDRIETSLAA